MKKLLSLSLVASALVLSACGSGSSEDAADKYVGTWLSKCHSYVASSGNTYFRRTTRTLTKLSATVLNTTHFQKGTYSDTACSTLINSDTYTYNSGKYTIGKSVTFVGASAEEMTHTDLVTNEVVPGFMTTSAGQWLIRTYLPTDGLPTSWSSTSPYTKQ
jgi:protein involved in sex pheromone biosynthesis